jgi:hypothetical protein
VRRRHLVAGKTGPIGPPTPSWPPARSPSHGDNPSRSAEFEQGGYINQDPGIEDVVTHRIEAPRARLPVDAPLVARNSLQSRGNPVDAGGAEEPVSARATVLPRGGSVYDDAGGRVALPEQELRRSSFAVPLLRPRSRIGSSSRRFRSSSTTKSAARRRRDCRGGAAGNTVMTKARWCFWVEGGVSGEPALAPALDDGMS